MKNSLVVLSGGNVAVKDLEGLMKKYEWITFIYIYYEYLIVQK